MHHCTPFKEEYKTGDWVFAYFNSNKQLNRYYKAFPITGPKFGLTQGFVKAMIVKVNKDEEDQTSLTYDVEYLGDFRDAYTHKKSVTCSGSNIPPKWIHPTSEETLRFEIMPPKPLLSLLCFRPANCYDDRTVFNSKSDFDVASDYMVRSVMEDNGVEQLCASNNMFPECYTCFLRESDDLRKFNIPMDLCLTGYNKVAFYFVWPTQKEYAHSSIQLGKRQ